MPPATPITPPATLKTPPEAPVKTPPAAAGVLSVGEFTRRIKALLEGSFPTATVRGEISNFRRQASGHCYFTLKDADSQLAAVLFRGDALRSRCELRDGRQVVATGAVSVYEQRGNYQLIVRHIEEDGVGRLQREFEELKKRLAAEGLFDKALKRPLPALPQRVGVITSPTGAALQDFLRILHRRDWRGHVTILPARVQGAEAAGEVIAMLRCAGALKTFDVIVVARGGGSLEDLWPFNEEALARAVRASPVPVISAVGHEIDFTLCDFAADVRAETPSAAAEMISSARLNCLENFANAADALRNSVFDALENYRRHLALAQTRFEARSPRRIVENFSLRLDDLRNRLLAAPRLAVGVARRHLTAAESRLAARSPRTQLLLFKRQLDATGTRIAVAERHLLQRKNDRLSATAKRLVAAGVDATLRRGFALVLDDTTGTLLRSAADLTPARPLRLRFADGTASATATGETTTTDSPAHHR
jgi:exodeoxyribonuclease VII large subunit